MLTSDIGTSVLYCAENLAVCQTGTQKVPYFTSYYKKLCSVHTLRGSNWWFPSICADQIWLYFKALRFVAGSWSKFPPLAVLPGLTARCRETLSAFCHGESCFVGFLRCEGHLSLLGCLLTLSVFVWVSLPGCSLEDVKQQLLFPNCFIFCGITSICKALK